MPSNVRFEKIFVYRPAGSDDVAASMIRCNRCGGAHCDLHFKKLSRDHSIFGYQHIGFCPTAKIPLLVRITGLNQREMLANDRIPGWQRIEPLEANFEHLIYRLNDFAALFGGDIPDDAAVKFGVCSIPTVLAAVRDFLHHSLFRGALDNIAAKVNNDLLVFEELLQMLWSRPHFDPSWYNVFRPWLNIPRPQFEAQYLQCPIDPYPPSRDAIPPSGRSYRVSKLQIIDGDIIDLTGMTVAARAYQKRCKIEFPDVSKVATAVFAPVTQEQLDKVKSRVMARVEDFLSHCTVGVQCDKEGDKPSPVSPANPQGLFFNPEAVSSPIGQCKDVQEGAKTLASLTLKAEVKEQFSVKDQCEAIRKRLEASRKNAEEQTIAPDRGESPTG